MSIIYKINKLLSKMVFNMKLHRFYTHKKGQHITIIGSVFDFLFTRIIIFAANYLWFVYQTKSPVLSVFLSLLMTILLSIAIHLSKQRLMIKKIAEKRNLVARDFLYDKLCQLNTEEFRWQLMKLLLKLPGIGDIKCRDKYIISSLHGRKIAIGCYHHRRNKVTPRQLSQLIYELRMDGFKEAIFITTGSFDEHCQTILNKKTSLKTHILEGSDLLDIMKKVGLYPDEAVIDQLIYNEINKRSQRQASILSTILIPGRIKTYLACTILFLVLSSIFKTFSIYYELLSVLFLVLALITYFWNGKRNLQSNHRVKIVNELTLMESSKSS